MDVNVPFWGNTPHCGGVCQKDTNTVSCKRACRSNQLGSIEEVIGGDVTTDNFGIGVIES